MLGFNKVILVAGALIMSRSKQSIVEDLMEIISMLPWWVGLVLAVISYIVLSLISTHFNELASAQVKGVGQMGTLAVNKLYGTLAMFGKFVVPGAFIFGSIASVIRQLKVRITDKNSGL